MVLTSEQVYQALVLSSVFLMAISVPKLALVMGWGAFRTFIFENKLGSKIVGEVLSKATIRENQKPDVEFKAMVNELASYVRELKKPFVELLAAVLLLPISASRLQVESDAVLVMAVIEALMIAMLLIAFVTVAKRVLKMKKFKGGGPLA